MQVLETRKRRVREREKLKSNENLQLRRQLAELQKEIITLKEYIRENMGEL